MVFFTSTYKIKKQFQGNNLEAAFFVLFYCFFGFLLIMSFTIRI